MVTGSSCLTHTTHIPSLSHTQPLHASLTFLSRVTRGPGQTRDTRVPGVSSETGCTCVAHTRLTGSTGTTLSPRESWETLFSNCAKTSVALGSEERAH